MEITNITSLRKELYSIMEKVIQFNSPVTVTTKGGNAILISEQEYNSMLETIYLLSQPGLVESIKEGEKENIEEMKEYDPNEEW